MNSFYMNGELWHIKTVDPHNHELVDRTGKLCLATTDPVNHYISLSNKLNGELFARVLIHELGHCAMISFNLLDEIHQMVKPDYWVEAEEFICNFIADYGLQIFNTAYELFGEDVLIYIPSEIEKMIA